MNRRLLTIVTSAAILSGSVIAMAQPLGTAFTYQGRLKANGLPTNAPVDLQFTLFDSAGTGSPPSGGTLVGAAICRDNVSVVDGLFTASLDFGAVFNGMERFLQIGVRPAGGVGDCGTGSYTPLSARQAVTGVPHAQWANLGGGGGGDCCEPRTDVETLPGTATAKHVINQPGSYYLRNNLTGISGKNGIEIHADGVTVNLNGFAMIGVGGSLDGVKVVEGDFGGELKNIAVKNGSVIGWGGKGVDGSAAINTRLADLLVSFSGETGISAGGVAVISGCSAYSNDGDGIAAGGLAVIANCSVEFSGEYGINPGGGSVVTNCTVEVSGNIGISASSSIIINCQSEISGGDGIQGSRCHIINCISTFSDHSGINAGNDSVVTNCTLTGNDEDGILVGANCTVRDNRCSSNGNGSGDGAGIHATGSSNRIEGNHCVSGDRGIEVSDNGNIIIRNTCTGSGPGGTTAWDIAANNVYGPIIDRRAPASPAVNGASAAGSLGTTDPNANFTY